MSLKVAVAVLNIFTATNVSSSVLALKMFPSLPVEIVKSQNQVHLSLFEEAKEPYENLFFIPPLRKHS